METVNLVQTVGKAITPSTPAVAVPSGDAVIQQELKSAGNVLPKVVIEKALSEKVKDDSSVQRIDASVKELNSFVQNIQRGIQFSVHEETGRSVITITDKETGEEIRRFPSDEVLAIAEQIAEKLAVPDDVSRGLFISESA